MDAFHTFDDHSVLLYGSDDRQLVAHVSTWLGAHLARQQPVLVVVTPRHLSALTKALRHAGLDVGALCRGGLFVSLDAAEIMRSVLENDGLSWTVFDRRFGDLVRELRTRGPLRVYGEAAGMLWKGGKREVSLELEEHWNRLRKQLDFELLCSYGIHVFGSEFATGAAAGVIRAHSAVVPLPSGDSSH